MKHKKRLLSLTAMLVFGGLSQVIAQYNSINFDYETAAVMAAEYNAAALAEMYYDEQVKDILEKYGIAEVAAAGIYTSKHLDRKALTSLGDWSSPTENYYYRRIYSLVSAKIIPELWGLSSLLLRYPHKAVYWGSYLAKTCTEIKSLCQQFESVVTNSTLSFSDINFLELNPNVAALIQLSKIGDVDWKAMLDGVTYVGSSFTKENLTNDLESFCSIASGLASSGYDSFVSDLMGSSEFNGTFLQKAIAVGEVATNAYDIYKSADGDMGNILLGYWGNNPSASDLFNFSSYDMTGWITDYLSGASDMYYTQRYYIASVDAGSEKVCDYNPPRDDYSVSNSSEWVRFDTPDTGFWPTSSQLEGVLSNSERYAGWTREMVNTLNQQNTGCTYSFSSSPLYYSIKSGGRQYRKAFAFQIAVEKTWNRREVVYEETFDSFSMNLSTFLAKMNGYLDEYNENEEGRRYQLLSDERHYYEVATEAKVKGCESAIITKTCTDQSSLSEGNTQYKCGDCGSTLNAHSKACSMYTTLSSGDEELDTSALVRKKVELEREIAKNQQQLEELLQEKAFLEERILSYPDKQSIVYKQLQNDLAGLEDKISGLRTVISSMNEELDQIIAAITEAENEPIETDDFYRIPAIMQDLKTLYGLTWQGEGWWSGFTFYRYASVGGINGTLTFQATLSLARKPQYVFGIKIHRAIVKITWKLSATYTETEIIDNLTFDSEMSDEEKARIVNEKLAELARDYPDCTSAVEYIHTEDDEIEDETEDVQHLLWASDRLAIARQVEARLMHIYANIVSMKKMMHYRLDVLDVLGNALPYVNDQQGRRQTLVQRCRRRWLRNAAEQHHSLDYNGQYEDEDETDETQ